MGIPLRLHFSWFLVLLLFAYSLATFLGALRPWWPATERWGVALAASVLLFASVVAHEMCHSLVALRYGIPVRSITLFMFGGAAHIAREAPRPGMELLIALAGPVCSVLLGLLFLGAGFLVERFSVHVAVMMSWLFLMNMALGIFNLIPGFPLDGGRVLRAAIWAVSGNYATATRVATMGGYATALLLMGLGAFVFIVSRSALQGMWLALVGWFLFQAAFMSYRQHRQRARLEGVTALELMRTRVPEVSPDASLRELINSGALMNRRGLLVVEDGRAVGLIAAASVGKVSRRARAAARDAAAGARCGGCAGRHGRSGAGGAGGGRDGRASGAGLGRAFGRDHAGGRDEAVGGGVLYVSGTMFANARIEEIGEHEQDQMALRVY